MYYPLSDISIRGTLIWMTYNYVYKALLHLDSQWSIELSRKYLNRSFLSAANHVRSINMLRCSLLHITSKTPTKAKWLTILEYQNSVVTCVRLPNATTGFRKCWWRSFAVLRTHGKISSRWCERVTPIYASWLATTTLCLSKYKSLQGLCCYVFVSTHQLQCIDYLLCLFTQRWCVVELVTLCISAASLDLRIARIRN